MLLKSSYLENRHKILDIGAKSKLVIDVIERYTRVKKT
tara:strand:- start:976 stop:1089 length:114 start_codon:yes stop_codon:yes gene_type:complete